MTNNNYYRIPDHGLQVEETLAAGDRMGVNSLARYWWAWSHLRRTFGSTPSTVWDLGCGCGYGSFIMSEALPTNVVAIDTDHKAMLDCWRDYPDPRIKFAEFYLENHWNTHQLLQGHKADTIVAFELLEQIKHREFFLEQVVNSLTPHGSFLLSVPTASRRTCNAAPVNSDADKPGFAYFHYNRSVLRSLLSRYFHGVRFGDDADEPTDGPFAYYKQLNPQIATVMKEHKLGEPYIVGADVIFCESPKV